MILEKHITAFRGDTCIAAGPVSEVLRQITAAAPKTREGALLFFDDESGEQIDFNLEGSLEAVLASLEDHPFFREPTATPVRTGKVGRPRLGVVSREVTLLPRHWSWLEKQPNGSSAALRRLVEGVMKPTDAALQRQRREVAAKVMWSLAGDYPNFEAASRALFRGEMGDFASVVAGWPPDVQAYLRRLAGVDQS